jgi:hypothetical protein
MHPKIIPEIVKGKGYLVLPIPFREICARNPRVSIDTVEELDAVITSFCHKLSDDDWCALFEYAIINKHGYPVTYEFAEMLDKNPMRFIYLIKRPVQVGSTKTLDNDTLESKLYLFGEALVKVTFGEDYKLDKLSVLLSEAFAEYQPKHIDYKAHGVKPDDQQSDFALMITTGVKGGIYGFPYSQHIVNATSEAMDAGIADNRMHSFVRDKLEKNDNFKIDIDDCKMKSIFFGTDEMLTFGDNFVHGGDKNCAAVEHIRLHFYITRIGSSSLNNKTVVLENLVWDLTKNAPKSVEKMYNNIETFDDYKKLKALSLRSPAGNLMFLVFSLCLHNY